MMLDSNNDSGDAWFRIKKDAATFDGGTLLFEVAEAGQMPFLY